MKSARLKHFHKDNWFHVPLIAAFNMLDLVGKSMTAVFMLQGMRKSLLVVALLLC
uniref:Uncharacterized protein n=1 Tax=Brassica oleracea TaxID=3712 RepID=A0A3P6GCU1_BRAOL|nr:unnamed protein product [Brassica oleracea]